MGGPANVIVAEKPKPQKADYGDFISWRPDRTRLASSSDFKPTITVSSGPLATTVEVASEFYGGAPSRRVLRFYKDFPRIDFETEVQDIPNITVVVAEFPLAEDIEEVRRGIPCGFSHGAWAKPNPDLVGWTKGIVPAVRWSHYSLAGGGGVAILDRGLTGRELNERTPIIYLLNATDKYYGYPNAWLSGKGKHHLEYALVAHEGHWDQARIPQMAWEYNCPPVLVAGRKAMAAKSFVHTSSNVIVEVVRREGKDIEMRLIECLGLPGTAEVTLNLPHQGAALTDLRGRNPKPLAGSGPTYRFPVRPLADRDPPFPCRVSCGRDQAGNRVGQICAGAKAGGAPCLRQLQGAPAQGRRAADVVVFGKFFVSGERSLRSSFGRGRLELTIGDG